MPELPEVETTLRGLRPHILGQTVQKVIVRCRRLRWPIADEFEHQLTHQTIEDVTRRGKYMLIKVGRGTLIIHLGMSGRLCILTQAQAAQRHDHVDILFHDQCVLRYTDPRRFGAMLFTFEPPKEHVLLKQLGVEPLSKDFTSDYLLQKAKNRRMPIKPFLMNNQIVVGIGNIYATEALFLAKIHPSMPSHALTSDQAKRLIEVTQQVLSDAIAKGGTTLKDFVDSAGKPGYFSQQLMAYGRSGQACQRCDEILESCVLGQRSSVFCPKCQPVILS